MMCINKIKDEKRRVILVVLDGWGISEVEYGNAIYAASTPNMDNLANDYPATALQASGVAAGLYWKEMGNSEVGHLVLGTGKILYQNLPKISLAIENKTFFRNDVLLEAIKYAKKNNSNIHLMGLVSNGGVHSHIDHLYAILELIKLNFKETKNRVFIHFFADGRDTNPKSALKFISDLINTINSERLPGKIASIIGRYYAMDRNENWDRTEAAYNCLVNGSGKKEKDPINAIKKFYKKGTTDEFIEPTLILDESEKCSIIKDSDSIIFFNIREDRARQLTKAFVLEKFDYFNRNKLSNICFTTMIEYEKGLQVNVAFPKETIINPLGKVLSKAGLKQMRIAETEKYAHVTYFFNGGTEKPFDNEFRMLVPSKMVSSYDQEPEMSAGLITDRIIKETLLNEFDFILANYANADMLGHTGNFEAAVRSIEFVDKCIGELYKLVENNGITLLITGDHGNAEEMLDQRNGEKITEHSTNPVPFLFIDKKNKLDESQIGLNSFFDIKGMLSDVAPTILEIFGIEKPKEMTGKSLINTMGIKL